MKYKALTHFITKEAPKILAAMHLNNMKKLTKKQKIYILKEMIRYYSEVKNDYRGMCYVMDGIIEYDLKNQWEIYYEYLEDRFPEFFGNKPKDTGSTYWFDIKNTTIRLKYCKKILKLINNETKN